MAQSIASSFQNYVSSEIAQIAQTPHKHDCARCIFMGQATVDGKQLDYYHCRKEDSLIIRHSDEGSDYRSMGYSLVERFKPECYMSLYRLVRGHKRLNTFDKMIKLYRDGKLNKLQDIIKNI